ncbi:MAG TPA: 50S ribosomal protein L4 [Verrucomicrobia bacterium]|nr:MAG: 50S ribosomal protein L4 [Lentisphaerae bacterium GWF2_57_35]HBA83550.1 50S ribosomal protein L4 [Verrucomicrobiota bacterium]
MSKLPVKNVKGESMGDMELADDLMVSGKGTQAVHDAIVAYRAARRAGSASTKKRGEVSGGGKKPFKQKGTGQARAGSTRSPIWRGGGTVFGPQPRSYAKKMNKKTSRLAFRRAFSDKVVAGEVMVVDQLVLAEPKTQALTAVLKNLSIVGKSLLVVDKIERNMALAARNIEGLELATSATVNTYQLLRYPAVLISKAGLTELEIRLRN